ncbi:rubrerythrin family protein [Limnohabitans sp.]|uniref:rubrerythrin family protein n=1 Tax=Limnohabitans sp. TaxID=1907725 RepID=UPI00311E417D
MTTLKGSRTEQALRDAFAWESQANRRYVYFANQAEEEGHADLAALFRSSAQGETGHAMGHLEFLQQVGDPVTGLPIGNTLHNLASALHSEIRESTEMYPAMAKVAREEGFNDVADWFETLAKAEHSHAQRYARALETLKQD